MMKILPTMIAQYLNQKTKVVLLFLSVSLSQAQTISSFSIASSTVCAGETVAVTFDVSSANGTPRQFTSSTLFEAYLSDVDGGAPFTIMSTFQVASLPAAGSNNESFTNIIGSVAIPLGTTPGTSYRLSLGCVNNPTIDGSTGDVVSGFFTVVAGVVGGAVSGGAAICSGNTSGLLSLTGNTGSVLSWESSVAPFTSWETIANTATTYTSGALTQTTQFRAVVQSGSCTPVKSESTTVTINTTTWNGTNWNNEVPVSTISALFEGDFVSTGTINACSIVVLNNATVTIAATHNVILNGTITVATGSAFILENNANLVQNATTGTNTGAIVVKRNSSALKRLDYTLWSAPVTGQGLYSFSPFTFANRFYTYATSSETYAAFTGFNITGLDANNVNGMDQNNATFSPAKSYLIRVPWNHPTAPAVWNGQFVGTPNTGNQTFPLAVGYNAVGNPYPSPINVHNFIDANTAITGTLYFWRKTNNPNASSYATLTKFAYTANEAAGGDTGQEFFNSSTASSWTINSAQGFIVEATTAVDLNFTDDMRRASNSNQFFKTTTASSPESLSIEGLYWLNLTSTQGAFSQMAVGYSPQATLGFDAGIDGKNINTESYLTSLIDASEYSVQGRPQFHIGDIVPLSFKATSSGNYTIALNRTTGLFADGTMIYLKDNVTNAFHALNGGSYTFAATAGTFNNRFEVHYQGLLNNVTATINENEVVLYSQNNLLTISTGTVNMSSVKIFDIRGRLLTSLNAINATTITTTVGQTNEVLLVQITDTEGTTVTKKVVK